MHIVSLFCYLILISSVSNLVSNLVSGQERDEQSQVLINVNHIIDFLQTIKKSQDDMFQKIEILSKSVESKDREEHKSRSRLQKKVTALENKITEIEGSIQLKMEEMVEKKISQMDKRPSSLPPAPIPPFYNINPRSSRDIAYFEPFRDSRIRPNSPNYLRTPDRTVPVADKHGLLNIQLLEESRQKITDFNSTLQIMKTTIFDVGKAIERFNETHVKEIEGIRRSESELEDKLSSTSRDVLALRQKQGELQRAIDTVLIHFSTLVLGLQSQDKKIEETRRNITDEIRAQINEIQTSLNQQQIGIQQEIGPTWPNDKDSDSNPITASALVNDEPPTYQSFQRPTRKIRGQYKSMQNNEHRSSQLTGIINNLTEEIKTQGEQISKLSSDLAKVNVSQMLLSRTMDEETLKRTIRPKDCSEIKLFRNGSSGLQMIFPRLNDNEPIDVLCDLESDGGGWTVIQRRGQTLPPGGVRENFFRNWTDYKNGFGSLQADFWIGLSNIAELCKLGDQELRIEMTKWNGEKGYANYKHFKIDDEMNLYKLNVSGYSGDAGDSLSRHNGMGFSTMDKDNDSDPQRNCAQLWEGAWWFYSCHESNLNGMYGKDGTEGSHEFGTGIIWFHWTGNYYSLKQVEIKIRNSFLARNHN